MKKTILHISKYYYPFLGGIETTAQALAEGLTDFQNIVVCFSSKAGGQPVETINGITIHRVHVNFSLMSQDIALGYYAILKRLVREYHPDYVHLHCPNPFLYPLVIRAIAPETKLLLHWHSDIIAKGIAYQLIKPLEQAILKRADRILTTSPSYVHPSSPVYTYRDKARVAQSGVVTADFDLRDGDEQRIEALRQQHQGKKIVLFTGRHIAYKGIDLLIEAERHIKSDCVIIITGSGPLTEKLKALPRSQRIVFTGRVSSDELRSLSHAADVFAFPSNTKAEAFGLALAEAMYCRCVPVVFHIEGSGVNWVSLKDQTGLEVPLGDVRAFAHAIDTLLTDDQLRLQYADACHQRVLEMFTDKVAVGKMNQIYHEL